MISANLLDGIRFDGATATSSKVDNNLIGLNKIGAALGNQNSGVAVNKSGGVVGSRLLVQNNQVGSNTFDGVRFSGGVANVNVLSNRLGLNNALDARGNTQNGLGSTGNLTNVLIQSNTAASNSQDGVSISAGKVVNVAIDGNTLGLAGKGNGGSGVKISGVDATGNGFALVTNNTSRFNAIDGLTVSLVSDSVTANNNTFSNNLQNGVRVSGSATTVLSANDIVSNNSSGVLIDTASLNTTVRDSSAAFGKSISANALDGVRVTGASTGTLITGNAIAANFQNGVQATGGSANTTVTGNAISANKSDGVLVTGAAGDDRRVGQLGHGQLTKRRAGSSRRRRIRRSRATRSRATRSTAF